MQHLSARPHHVGSPYDKDNAEWILARFKEWGLDAHIETFNVLFPTPRVRVLEMVAPTKFTAKLDEPAIAIDPTSNQKSEQLPTYNAYSIDGDVTAPLVFVNYGLPVLHPPETFRESAVQPVKNFLRAGNHFTRPRQTVSAAGGSAGPPPRPTAVSGRDAICPGRAAGGGRPGVRARRA